MGHAARDQHRRPEFDYDDKVGVWTGNREDDVIVRRSTRVPYFDGEV
jgi:hypothetical protein